MILDTTLALVEKHKNLPLEEKETFALAFKKLSDSLANYQDQKLERLQELPRRLPDALIQPKVTFIPGRKRALTGREAADIQEKEEARERRRLQIGAEIQSQNDIRQEHAAVVYSQLQDEVAAAYVQSQHTALSQDIITISSESEDDNEFIDIDMILTRVQTRDSVSTTPVSIQPSNQPSDQSSSIAPISIQSRRLARDRQPTAKQASQNRRAEEREQKRLARLSRKPTMVDTTQLEEFELPFRSSQ